MDEDWSVFAVASFADAIAYRLIPVGAVDIADPGKGSAASEQLLDGIAAVMAELQPAQTQKVAASGVHCFGLAATDTWAGSLGEQLGLPCHLVHLEPHPAVIELREYVDRLDVWKATLAWKTKG